MFIAYAVQRIEERLCMHKKKNKTPLSCDFWCSHQGKGVTGLYFGILRKQRIPNPEGIYSQYRSVPLLDLE